MKQLLTFLMLFSAFTLWAQVGAPRLNVQGALKNSDGAAIPDGTKTMTFKLYHDGAGGTAQWQETAEVTVTGGVYNYNLGSTTPIDLDVFSTIMTMMQNSTNGIANDDKPGKAKFRQIFDN